MSKTMFKIAAGLEFAFSAVCGISGIYILINLALLLEEDGEGIGITIAKSLGVILLPVIAILLFIIGASYLVFGIKTHKGATKGYEIYRQKQKSFNVCLILEILILIILIVIMFLSTESASGLIWLIYGFMSAIVLIKFIGRVLIEREYYLIHKSKVDNT